MKIQRLRIEQVRQFRRPFELGELAPGLNLIHGPNESGKSTLVRAIRAAFFERHRSNTVEDLRPWGDSAAAPYIEIEFQCQGQNWHLTKSFLQKKRCDLQVAGQSFDGDEAEDKLAELLCYQIPARGASQEKHWGIPGLLWVEQGTGQNIEQAVAHAGDHLKSALNSLLGEVASSGGDDIIQAVRKQREELLTPTGRTKGEYAELAQLQTEQQQRLAALDERITSYQAQVDRLGDLRQQHQQAEKEKPWEASEQQYRQAEQRYREIEQWRQEQQGEQQALENCQETLALLCRQKQQAEQQAQKLEERQKEYSRAKQTLEALNETTDGLAQTRARVSNEYQAAHKTVRQAKLRDQRERLSRDLAQLERQLKTLDDCLSKAQDYQEQLETSREQHKQNAIDLNALNELKKTHEQLNEARIRSQVVATRLAYELNEGQSLELDGQSINGSGDHLLMDASVLAIPGVGTVRITPGGEDLGKLRRKLERLQSEYNSQLQALGLESLEEAEQRASRQRDSQAAVKRLRELMASVAPNGLEILASDQQREAERLNGFREELKKLPEPEGDAVSLNSAEAASKAADTRLTAAETKLQEHQQQLTIATQQEVSAKKEWQQLRRELEAPERQSELQHLQQKMSEANEKERRLSESIAKRQEQIDQARPDFLKQDMERLKASAEQQEKTHHERAIELGSLQSRLESQGAEGLEEQRNELAAELEHTVRRYTELDRRAQALELLLTLLQEKRQALTRRLQAPLQKHLDHYLGVLFPQASLEVDEHLVPGQFSRNGELGQMNELSFGAREQMGLISRLAYADLLKDAGRPTLIILDDTLVHSDWQRLAQMKRILFDAGQRHQILLFTCHPDNWRDLGVAPRDLAALKADEVV